MDALISGHSWDAKKESITGAGRLREIKCKNTGFVGSREKQGFVKVAVSRAVSKYESGH